MQTLGYKNGYWRLPHTLLELTRLFAAVGSYNGVAMMVSILDAVTGDLEPAQARGQDVLTLCRQLTNGHNSAGPPHLLLAPLSAFVCAAPTGMEARQEENAQRTVDVFCTVLDSDAGAAWFAQMQKPGERKLVRAALNHG